MKPGKNNSNIQKKVIKLFLLLGIGILLITFFFGDHGVYHLYTIKSERSKIQKEIDSLRAVSYTHLTLPTKRIV